jgi:ankyrin repeat protein
MHTVQLIDAVRTGLATAVQQALGSGADANEQDVHGWTPLCWAAGRGELDIIELLVEHGADPRKTGRDNRTPAAIALAAGRVEAARRLLALEKREPAARKFCKAYRLRDLRAFDGWMDPPGAVPEIAYVHETYQVTVSMWPDEDVLFDGRSAAWQQFCREALGFAVPDDLDLIGRHE